jgi:hypothetical protein
MSRRRPNRRGVLQIGTDEDNPMPLGRRVKPHDDLCARMQPDA